MWKQDNRCRYDRSHLRYPSDLADEEWAEIALRANDDETSTPESLYQPA